ncbi:hypothetical protein [Winogradskyella sp. A2]|uniref:hypothetical protein n=1 Tax=Winogradskyella sp. A2 TaxID=3366944 RepID=UPI00398C4A38
MKSLLLIVLCLLSFNTITAQEVLELDASQSMCITGKGPGQDGAINPYINKDSYAIVENIGTSYFEIRIQKKGELIKIITIKSSEKKKILLLKGQELYFDTNEKSKAKIDFEEKPN